MQSPRQPINESNQICLTNSYFKDHKERTDDNNCSVTTRQLSYRKDDHAMRPIYRCPENFRESPKTPTATFREILVGFCSINPTNVRTKFEVRIALPVLEIIVIAILVGVAKTQSRGRGGRRGLGILPFERALMSSYRSSTVTFPLSLRVSEILPPLCSSTPLFPSQFLFFPKFPMFPWE